MILIRPLLVVFGPYLSKRAYMSDQVVRLCRCLKIVACVKIDSVEYHFFVLLFPMLLLGSFTSHQRVSIFHFYFRLYGISSRSIINNHLKSLVRK